MKPYLIIAIVLLVALVAACTQKLPDAMHYETQKRQIANAKVYRHMPGYYEYQQFTQNNK